MILTVCNWIAALGVGLIGYAYVGYPALVAMLARVRRPLSPPPEPPDVPLTLVIPAYNEESVIAGKIKNALGLDWPAGKLEILVVSDGSTDRTDDIARSFIDPRVRFLRIEQNAGKLNALNTALKQCRGDLVALTDANALFEPDALRQLARHLANEEVGAVCGELKYRQDDPTKAGESEGLYWRYEKLLKQSESRIGSLIGANGSIYMIRRADYPFPRMDLMDDLSIPLLIYLETGRVTRFESRALAWEQPGENFAQEYRRKVRIITRGMYTLLALAPRWARHPLFALQILSHKFSRWFVPVFAMAVLAASMAGTAFSPSPANPLYWLLSVQIAFLLAGLMATASPRLRERSRLFGLVFYFLVINTASLQAIWNTARGKRFVTWRTIRSEDDQ